LTNNPRKSRDAYARKLTALGIAADASEVITSSFAMARYLASIGAADRRLFVVGEELLKQELRAAGFRVIEEGEAEIVIVSFDTTLTYAKLLTAHRALLRGARFLATNPDAYCPTRDGGLPDAGALIAALQTSTGRCVEAVVGKPSRFLAGLVLDELRTSPARCVMVGDRAETDVRFGAAAGMLTVLVRTGATGDAELPPDLRPDHRLGSVADLPSALQSWVEEQSAAGCGATNS
jgi:HAD superfamily hydrolase (TIGR01450 family)